MNKVSSRDIPVTATLRIFYEAARKHRRSYILAFLNPVSAVLLTVAAPFYAGKILAGIASQTADLTTDLVLFAVCSAAGIITGRIGFINLMTMQAKTLSDLHATTVTRLLRRGTGFHVNTISGKLVSDVIDYVNAFTTLSGTIFVNGLPFFLTLVAGLVVVFINTWQLGLVLTIMVSIILVWAGINSRVRSNLRAQRLVASKALTAHMSDSIINAQTVKTFAQEKREIAQNKKLNKTLEQLRVRDWSWAGRSGSNRRGALLAMQFGMMLIVIHLTRDNPALLGTGIFAFTYTLLLSTRLFELDALSRQAEEAFLNASPIVSMLAQDIEIQDKAGAGKLRVPHGNVEIANMSFAYPEKTNDSPVFSDFTLSIRPGEKVGLVGPSGGGKSTLTRLLLRFDDLQSGSISIDGQNIADVTQASLRHAIAYVPQEPLLFHRTIRENIAYGNMDADDKMIIAAAKKANAHEFIEKLPNGYDTIVGERGVKLSGGQRQRVAIARAILKNAPLLILDEATSALDSENEQQVQEALWHLMQDSTTLVIAHRLSTIQRMDRIVVLDDGKIVEEGPHQKLLAHKGLYAKLWKHQSGGFIEA